MPSSFVDDTVYNTSFPSLFLIIFVSVSLFSLTTYSNLFLSINTVVALEIPSSLFSSDIVLHTRVTSPSI